MITLGIGTFICIVGCTFVVGGVVGLILTACLTAEEIKTITMIFDYFS